MGKMEQNADKLVFKNFSPGVIRLIRIMELLAQQKACLTDISKKLSIPISTVSNMINTLVMLEYVERDGAGCYAFTNKIMKLTQGFLANDNNLRAIAKPFMEELVNLTKETSQLGILLKGTFEVLYIEKVDSPLPVSLKSYVGATLPTYCTAIGKVLLSSIDDDKLNEFFEKKQLEKQTVYTITNKEKLLAEIKLIRQQGYAIDNMEYFEEARCIAFPIFYNNEVIAGISISGPVTRMTDAKIEEYVPLLAEYAQKITSICSGFAQVNF